MKRRAAILAGRHAGLLAGSALAQLAVARFPIRVTQDAAETPAAEDAPQASRQVRRAAARLTAKGKRS